MNRELLERIKAYFAANVVEDDCIEQEILDELDKEMGDYDIASLNKPALERHGYDTSDLSDGDMVELAGMMGDSYCNSSQFDFDLETACQEYGVTKQ